jgi:hypothetical protein
MMAVVERTKELVLAQMVDCNNPLLPRSCLWTKTSCLELLFLLAVTPILPLVLETFFTGFANFYLLDPFRLKYLMSCQTTNRIGI